MSTPSGLNWADWIIIGVVVFSTLISFARGFVREAISLVSWVLAAWLAYRYGHDFANQFLTMIEVGQVRSLIGSAILFFAVLVFGAFINYSISGFLKFSGLSMVDRTLGMAFGFARGVLLIAVFLLGGQIIQMDKKTWWQEAQLIPMFDDVSHWLASFVPNQVQKLKEQVNGEKSPEQTQEMDASAHRTSPQDTVPAETNKDSGISIRLAPQSSSITIQAAPSK